MIDVCDLPVPSAGVSKAPKSDGYDLVGKHSPILWKVGYRLLGHDADVRDCHQNALVSGRDVARSDSRSWLAVLER